MNLPLSTYFYIARETRPDSNIPIPRAEEVPVQANAVECLQQRHRYERAGIQVYAWYINRDVTINLNREGFIGAYRPGQRTTGPYSIFLGFSSAYLNGNRLATGIDEAAVHRVKSEWAEKLHVGIGANFFGDFVPY